MFIPGKWFFKFFVLIFILIFTIIILAVTKPVDIALAVLLILLVISLILLVLTVVFSWIEYPNCPACGEFKSDDLWIKDKLEMVTCHECGQVYANPRYAIPRRFLFLQYWSWKDTADPDRRSRIHSRENLEQNILPKLELLNKHGFNGNGKSLLDVGCGTGAFMIAAHDRGFSVHGIEPGWHSSRYGWKHHSLRITNTTLEKFRLDEHFDVVTSLHVIEHVPNPPEFVNHLMRLVKPDGIIIIATPNLGCEYARDLGVKWEAVGPADHLLLFDSDTLERLLLKSGLDLVEMLETGKNSDELVAVCKLPNG
jgi:2-polyprenyl-3-methyl-5-hydroxy-6-metoxy-1,4-benzoquinol methylase